MCTKRFPALLVLCALVEAVSCIPLYSELSPETAADDSPRLRRSTFGNITLTPPYEYMRRLYFAEYSDTEGSARRDPTDVWCFSDTDVVRQNFRESLRRSEKCGTFTQYKFKWASLSMALSERELGVEKAILRTYIQVIQRHVREGESVNVTLTATMNIDTGENDTVADLGVFAGQLEINVANNSDKWIELNVTEGTRTIWELVQNHTKVQVVIKAEVNCTQQKKVPINFVNPAEVPLYQHKRRERLLLLQPFIVVTVRDEVKMKEITNMDDDNNIMDLTAMDRKKRNIYSHCALSNFSIIFHHIGLTNVLNPYQVNIRKCSGHCSHAVLRRYSSLGTNHAKVMASVHLLQAHNPTSMVTANGPAEEPCCVPMEYDSIYIHMFDESDGSFVINRYNNFIATACGCQ